MNDMTVTAKRKITEEKVWMKYYSEEARNAELPKCKAYDYVLQCNKDRMDKPALHYYGRDITWNEMVRRIDDAAKAYTALGVQEGDVVSFVSAGLPETICSVYALNRLGAIANTIDPRMDVASIRRNIMNSGSRILVALDIAFPKIRPIMREIRQEMIIVQSAANSLPLFKKIAMKVAVKTDVPYSAKVISWNDFIVNGKDAVVEDSAYVGDGVVAITYTGGTTGFPKGVMMTNDSMNSVALNFKYSAAPVHDNDRFLGIIPIFAAYGMVCGTHMPLCIRTTLVPIPKFVPQEIGKLVKTYRPNHLISTPVFIELLIGSKEVQNMDLSFLYTLASGGDSMNEGLEKKLNEFRKAHNMQYPLAQGYGMSELSAAASFCVNDVYKQGSVGIPSLTLNVGIFDPETGEELTYGEIGEVCVSGPSVMKGYYNNPEETAYVMREHADGKVWVHSGDLGCIDEDGFLYIKGRFKRMITRFDGHKVFPINLESLIGARPDVHNCAVIGVNDSIHSQGQYPMVLVEPMPDVADPKALCKEIFEHCDQVVEERGKPVAVLPVEELPLTPMGKIDYRTLEDKYRKFYYLAWNPGE